MTILKLLEIVLIVMLLRALFPVLLRLVRRVFSGGSAPAERFRDGEFDKKKEDIEDGEFKELK
jgi:hypothetical protein